MSELSQAHEYIMQMYVVVTGAVGNKLGKCFKGRLSSVPVKTLGK